MQEDLIKIFAEIIAQNQDNSLIGIPFKEFKSWDSLKHMELIIRVEDKFEINFTGEEIASIKCLRDMIQLLSGKKDV